MRSVSRRRPAAEVAARRAVFAGAEDALTKLQPPVRALLDADWMVTCDWTGRDERDPGLAAPESAMADHDAELADFARQRAEGKA